MRNALLVYPEFPPTYWSFKYALPFEGTRSAFPPLGLLTIAPLLPKSWNKRLVDMNMRKLRDRDLEWADVVFLSAMLVQQESFHEVVQRCKEKKIPTVAGGPYVTTGFDHIHDVDYLVLGEAEVTLPPFLQDLERGQARRLYQSEDKPELEQTPIPDFDLLEMKRYSTMGLQYSRGCPFNCEFCDIIEMFGRRPRTKSNAQMLQELDELYRRGWRKSIFIVDDNFIGNKKRVKQLLPDVAEWMKERGHPFRLFTEASVNLADDDELLHLMAQAGFNKVFLGVETPVEESLKEAQKLQNTRRSLMDGIKKIQSYGMQVMAGFIVGFDHDPEDIFDRMIRFIQESCIPMSMVSLLSALPDTQLYRRLKKEGRLLEASTGNNTDCTLTFLPKMNSERLVEGYKEILKTIYHPAEYYERVLGFLERYRPHLPSGGLHPTDLRPLIRSVFKQGILGSHRTEYWKFLAKAYRHHREVFAEAFTLAIMGYHFQKVTQLYCRQ
ncbi:MAG: B12-binding domain-containing radical SAM protein [Acidobacteria bacterium]|nr:B12-binding domain-containing radical SAM protein [Acidobacteriota bacterium]